MSNLAPHSVCATLSGAMSGKGQAYYPKCRKLNPGHEYGRCELVKCTICKELGHSSFSAKNKSLGFVSLRTISKVLVPSITRRV